MTLGVEDSEGLTEGDTDTDRLPVKLGLGVGLAELQGELLVEALALAATVTEARPLAVIEPLALGEPAPDTDTPGDEDADRDDETVTLCVADTLWLCEDEPLTLPLAEAHMEYVATPLVGTGLKEMLVEEVDDTLPESLVVTLPHSEAL